MKLLPVAVVGVVAAAWITYQGTQPDAAGLVSCGPTGSPSVLQVVETTGGALHTLTAGPPPSDVVAQQTLGTMGVVSAWGAGFVAAIRGDARPEVAARYEAQAVAARTAQASACQPCPQAGVQPAGALTGPADITRAAAAAAGFTGADLDVAVAVAAAESGHRDVDNAGTNPNGTVDHGRWQINTVHADLLAAGDWRDPHDNARMAYAVWERAGRSWTPWVTYTNGAYRQHLTTTSATPAASCTPGHVTTAAAPGSLQAPLQGRVSSPYGQRTHPVTGERRLHGGTDIAAPCGTPVTASAPGTIHQAGRQGSYGNIVVIDHGNGTMTAYAHLSRITTTTGTVTTGQTIGHVGATGTATGCHLHYEIRQHGQRVNPTDHVNLGNMTA